MSDWFIQTGAPSMTLATRGVDGQPADQAVKMIGPIKPNELLKRVRDGDIKPHTLLRKDDSAWFPASTVGGLFEAAVAPTLAYHCPNCQTQVPAPPCNCPRCDQEIQFLRPQVIQNSIRDSEPASDDKSAAKSRSRWLDKVSRRKKK